MAYWTWVLFMPLDGLLLLTSYELHPSDVRILDDAIGETATDLRDATLLFEASPFLLSTDDRLARLAFVFAKELAVGA